MASGKKTAKKGEEAAGRAEIYALSDPRTGEVRYIGKSINAEKRLEGHIWHSRAKDLPVSRWIRKLAKEGLKPSVSVILTVEGDWQDAERAEIAKARAAGVRLLNIAEGGEQPHTYYKEYPYVTKSYRRLEARISGALKEAKSGKTECEVYALIKFRLAKEAYARAVASARRLGRMDWLEEAMKNSFLFAGERNQENAKTSA